MTARAVTEALNEYAADLRNAAVRVDNVRASFSDAVTRMYEDGDPELAEQKHKYNSRNTRFVWSGVATVQPQAMYREPQNLDAGLRKIVKRLGEGHRLLHTSRSEHVDSVIIFTRADAHESETWPWPFAGSGAHMKARTVYFFPSKHADERRPANDRPGFLSYDADRLTHDKAYADELVIALRMLMPRVWDLYGKNPQ